MKLPRLVPAIVALTPFVACGEDDGYSSAESQQVASRLRQCDLVSDGRLYPAVGDSSVARCIAQCSVDATCDELEKFFCLGLPSDRVASCQAGCFGPRTCDGGENSFDLRDRCDGVNTCNDGADEDNCPEAERPLYCEPGGERIWAFQRCDGVWDCPQGTDEESCDEREAEFTCKTDIVGFKRVIRQSQVCDLVPDCPDGSDEGDAQGCAKKMCPSP